MAEMFVYGTIWFWGLCIAEVLGLLGLLIWDTKASRLLAPITIAGFFGILYLWGGFNVVSWCWNNPWIALSYSLYYLAIGLGFSIIKWGLFNINIRSANRKVKADWFENLPVQVNNKAKQIKENRALIEDIEKEIAKVAKNDPRATWSVNRVKELIATTEELEKEIIAYKESIDAGLALTEKVFPYWKQYEKDFYYTDWSGDFHGVIKPILGDSYGRIMNWWFYWPIFAGWTFLNDPIRRLARLLYNLSVGTFRRVQDSIWKNEEIIFSISDDSTSKTNEV